MSRPGREASGPEGIGQANAGERRALRRAGLVLAAGDLLWIPQAGLIALVLGWLLEALHGADPLPQADLFGSVPVLASLAGLVGLACLRALLQVRGAGIARQAARSVQTRARAALLAAAAGRSPASDFPSSGAFAAHVSEQVDLLGPYYRNFLPQKVRLRVVPLAIILATASVSWLAALILLVCGPLIPVFMALVGVRAKAASARQQDELTRLSGVLLDRIRGLETLALFGALERTREDITAAGERFRAGTMRVLKIAFLSSTVLELFSALGIAFCAVYVGFSLLGEISAGTWSGPLGYAGGLFVLLLAPEFFAPLRAYAAAYHDRAGGLAASEKLGCLLGDVRDAPDTRLEASDATKSLATPPAISCRQMTFGFDTREIFRDLSLEISSGETVFLTGPSGSGKTSLIDLLLGFQRPVAGSLKVAGLAPHLHRDTLLARVCWLGQTPRLFHGSLRANLLRGADDPASVSEANLWEALELAGARGLAERLPRGLATPLGEDGFGLSVGEIRRVALARAALRRGAVLLLADEPTAGLDAETAALVIRGLGALAEERTAVIATHDPLLARQPGRVIDLGHCTAVPADEVPA